MDSVFCLNEYFLYAYVLKKLLECLGGKKTTGIRQNGPGTERENLKIFEACGF